ncbi:Capsule polysaccharide export protein-like protein [Roseobacter sp. AzwK-3b]|uniref:hypothetical protein n=1 Tax=Roseobacter sp. AzwK-3b TaxID=351016 RepID=UPI0001568F6F|nr:hypothetical protein [Roseobacter sp. AzwK-3b]EDM73225.1 Capsule polysaccharide export protein-like protein [Roseobacter sp. AzwK-3b]
MTDEQSKGEETRKDPQKSPVAGRAMRRVRPRKRHLFLMISAQLLILLPALVAGWYLWERAADQYASYTGFTIRREEAPTPTDVLGSLGSLSAGSSSDSDVLFEYIHSQDMIGRVGAEHDLRAMFSRYHERDPVFALRPDGTREDLRDYWRRMVQVSYTSGSGLIEVRVNAFAPQDAQDITQAIFDQSLRRINDMTAIARADSIRFASTELASAEAQLQAARQALTVFRSANQVISPEADIQVQMGLINTLQQQLGEELIKLDLLSEQANESDPRAVQSKLRIEAIRKRISEERRKLGGGADMQGDGEDYASIVTEFEKLTVDREFAEKKYTTALSNFDTAQAEARRQTRYLAAFEQPTLPESAEYPRRWLILGLTVLFLSVGWSILVLIYYSLRDRR